MTAGAPGGAVADTDAAAARGPRHPHVVVVGDALIDELRDERGVREIVGGAALNVAVGLRELGVPATLVAMIGDDAAGERIRAHLREHGVALIETISPLGTARAVSTRDAGGEPAYVFNDAAQARRIRFAEAAREAMADAAAVVISCFPFDDGPQTAELAEALAETAAIIAIDANPRAGMLRDRAAFVAGFEALAPDAALLKVGDDDAALLYGATLDELRERLIALGTPVVVATRGAEGATIDAEGVTVSAPVSQLPGSIVDTMGAGDATLASLVAELVEHGAPSDHPGWRAALERAMDIAAATCRAEGALLRHPATSGAG
ncbi:MAG TPA: PfkB family carbohydrate kinase [Microbacteriaceae bacterium]|nr:PfkB family carbohydrate kinase [Microbacteriaceae bacterium]HQC92409.1 PfkB family carbohydrate kinase [Microbacteriaceae bacterium]